MTLEDVRNKAEALQLALADVEPGLRVGWLTYVLEGLEVHVDADEFEALLVRLVDEVQGRLTRGRW